MTFLRLHLLGAPHIERDGQAVHIERRRALALCVYLAVTGVAHSRDTLTALFWPEASQSAGRASLRRMLHVVSHALGDEFVRSADDKVRFHRNGDTWLDVEQFRRMVAACHRHGHDVDVVCPDCLPVLTQAADLYRDDFLAGFSLPDSPDFDRWQFFQSEQARTEMALVLELLTRGYVDQGHFAQAMVYAQRRLAFDPLHEPAHRQLMQLYTWTEQPAAALRQYELCTRLLAQDLGVAPAEETEALRQSILARRLARPARMVGAELGIGGPGPPLPAEAFQASEDDIRVVTAASMGLVEDDDTVDMAVRAEQVQRLFQTAVEASQRYGGHVERVVGEDILLLFGRDRVHEDDAERAVRASLEVIEHLSAQALPVRAGVDTGMAYCQRQSTADVTVVGGGVSLATRLRNRAAAGGILVGRTTYLATRGLCDYAVTPLQLSGVDHETTAYAVIRLRLHPAKERGIEGLASELVGRSHEMALLHTALAKALAGDGQVVAVVGEAGIGKSRLVAELRRSSSFGIRNSDLGWLDGRGVEHAAGSTYWLFADLLRGHLSASQPGEPVDAAATAMARRLARSLQELADAGCLEADEVEELGPLLGWLLSLRFDSPWDQRLHGVSAEQVRRRAFAAVQHYLTALAQRQPLALVFEDLHWADALSLALVEALLDALPGHRLLLLCVYRPEAMQDQGQLAAAARRKCAGRFTELLLQPLSPSQSRQMIASLLAIERLPPAMREEILAKAQGNPLFLEELVRALVDAGTIYRSGEAWRSQAEKVSLAVPASLQSVVLSRVHRMALPMRRLLQAASVFGRLFRPAVLARLMPEGSALGPALAELTAHGFVCLERAEPEPEYTFRHVLVRDAIYQDLPRGRRAELHARAGQALENHFAADLQPHVAELAHHYDLGDAAEKAAEFLLKAGQKAQAAYLNQEALAYFRRALARAESLPAAAGPGWRLAALRGLGEVYATLGDLAQAEPPLRQAMALAQQLGRPPAEQVQLYFPLCHLLRWLGRFDQLRSAAREGLTVLEGAPQREAFPERWSASAEAAMMVTFLAAASYLTGRRRQFRSLIELVVNTLRQLAYSQQLSTAYSFSSWWYRDVKRVPEAHAWIAFLADEACRRHDLWTVGYLRSVPGYWLPEAVGDIAALTANLEEAVHIADMIGDEVLRGYALTFLGLVTWGRGQLAQAEAMLEEALAIHERANSLHMRVLNRKGIGFVRLCRHDWAGAAQVLERGLAEADAIGLRVHGVQMSRLALARAYRTMGRADEAAALYRRVAEEDEADGDGQVWIAFALSGLEQTLDDPAAFRAACRRIAAARPAADPLPLMQWWLRPVSLAGSPEKFDYLGTSNFSAPAWTWCDPYGDCSCTLDDSGAVIYAANYYRDLWFNNVSAPRLMHSVRGDFAVEVTCSAAGSEWPAMGGLVLWQDAQNYVRLAWGAHGLHALDLMGSLDNRDLYLGRGWLPSNGCMHLRLERVGSTVRALCGADGKRWFSVGQVEFPEVAPQKVGVFAVGMIHAWAHPGEYPDGAAIRFQGVRLWMS